MKSLLKNTMFAISVSVGAMAILTAPTLSAQAAVPTEASLKRLIKVTKVLEQLNELTGIMFKDNSAVDVLLQENLQPLPNDKDNNSDGLDDFTQSIIENYLKSYITVAKRHYTQQEVDAMIAFYSTDIGQSIVDKQAMVAEDYIMKFESDLISFAIQDNENLMDKEIDDSESNE